MGNAARNPVDEGARKLARAGSYAGEQASLRLGGKNVEMLFCWCPPTPPGQPALLGSPPDEPLRSEDEKQSSVVFSQGFWIAKYPVNQAQWEAVMGDNPSQRGQGDQHPVDSVSWEDGVAFCKKTGLRLPSEAEWEYACRAGTSTHFGIGGGNDLNSQMANFDGNHPYGNGRNSFKWLERNRTLPQGWFPPNAWGLHDMHGQLWEWCEDILKGRDCVLRGGSWIFVGRFARSAYRFGFEPEIRNVNIGFRPCPSSTSQGQSGSRPEAESESLAERGKE